MFKNRKHKDIDLLKAYLMKSEPSKSTRLLKIVLPPLLVTLAFVSIFAVNQLYIHSLNKDIATVNKEIEKYNNKISVIGNEDYNRLVKLQEQSKKIQEVTTTLQTYPKLTSDLMNVFTANLLNGMRVDTIKFEDGVIDVSLQSSSVLNIETYVRSVRESGNFMSVDYKGYSVQETTTTSPSMEDDKTVTSKSTKYVFTITCIARGVN